MKEKITVIIPCYNAESYIDKCIESLKNQTMKKFCIIFIDDASDDKTADKITQIIKDSKLNAKLIINKKNSGPAYSRNKGIEECETQYLTFCDCDDWYERDFLEVMLKALEKNKADVAFCGHKIVSESGKIEYRSITEKNCVLPPKMALKRNIDSMCMMLVRTQIMKDTLLPDIRNGEDMAVIPLIIAKSEFCVIVKDCLYNYYRRLTSASQLPSANVVKSFKFSYRHICINMPADFKEELEYIGIRDYLYSSIITIYSIKNGKKKDEDAIELVNEFEKVYPLWEKNPNVKELPNYKRLVLFLVKKRWFFAIRFIAKLRNMYAKR